MYGLQLTREEVELMRRIIEGHLSTLDLEVNRADHADFKRMLKDQREVVAHLLERLSVLPASEPSKDVPEDLHA